MKNFKINLFLFLLLTSCIRKPYQTYEGSILEKQQTSILYNAFRLAPTSGDRIKIQKIDNKEVPGVYQSYSILPGMHMIEACYSQEYSCSSNVQDAWGGNCCSIYGNFNIEYNFKAGEELEFEIRPIRKQFAIQEIQVLIKNLNTNKIEAIPLRGVNLGLDCYKDEPDTSEFIGGKCF